MSLNTLRTELVADESILRHVKSGHRRREWQGWLAPAIFLAFGVLALGAARGDFPPPVPDILLAVGSTLIGGVVVSVIWWFLGGEPVTDALGRLERATDTLEDVVSLQIEALHGSRQHPDRSATAAKWAAMLGQAREIDIVGSSLKFDWYDIESIQDSLANSVRRGAAVRLSMLCPGERADHEKCGALSLRLGQQAVGEATLLPHYVAETFSRVQSDVSKFSAQSFRGDFHAYTTCNGAVYAFILRIDSYFFVAPYLTSGRGRDSIAFEFFGERSAWGNVYRRELDAIFRRGSEIPSAVPPAVV
ncbi:hypothetical protein [Nocardioides sp.]|uniref:hypothetical protein n=1 Tax=Nocardioides sp. TaxID=35761 RepID=UPI003D131014